MAKSALYRLAGFILLTGCLPSTYKEGMTVIGIPEALPSEGYHPSVAKRHDEDERFAFADWLEECKGKLGSDISTQLTVTMQLPHFDLEEGWSAPSPHMSVDMRSGATFSVERFYDQLSRGTGSRAIGITAVLGRFTLRGGNTEALSYLTDFTRDWNKELEDADRLWFSRARAGIWTSGLMALSLERKDGEPRASYNTFARWLRETGEKEAVTWPLLETLRLNDILSEEAVLGSRLVGASGLVSFDAIALTLERNGASIGCLPVTTH